jgi:hypothetical protein
MLINNIRYNKVLFVHVPKTGGTSISKFLIDRNLDNWVRVCPVRHDPYFILEENNNIDNLDFTFSTVRNPYTRMYSYYHHFQKIWEVKLSFYQFLCKVRSRDIIGKTPWITFPQHHFLFDKCGKFSIKKVYKFENLQEFENDFGSCLPKLNAGEYNLDDYMRDYTDKCISLVRYICFLDFQTFSYSLNFDNSMSI